MNSLTQSCIKVGERMRVDLLESIENEIACVRV